MYFKIYVLFVVLSVVYGVPLSTKYGVPNKPFEKYGLPSASTDELILDQVRIPAKKVVPVIQTKPTAPVKGDLHEDLIVPPKSNIQIRDKNNQYSVGFQEENGTEVLEQGKLISTDNGWEYVIAKTGSYKYTSPEGKLVEVSWIADEKGFRILSSTV